MRLGYYWLKKNGKPFSQKSPEVVKFFEELVDNDMIEFSVEEKVRSLSYKNLPYTTGFKDRSKEKGLSIKEYVKFLLENPDEQVSSLEGFKTSRSWFYRTAVWAKKHFYNDMYEAKTKETWCFLKKQKDYLKDYPKMIKVISFEEFLEVDLRRYELQMNQLITKKEFIKEKLKNGKFDWEWFFPLLEENTIIKGFKISNNLYTNSHQNLFQKKIKLSSLERNHVNRFLLNQTKDKKHKLYLCKEMSFNPNKSRLVLKSHKEDQIIGIIPLNVTVEGKKFDKNTHVKIPVSDYKIGHLKFNSEYTGFETISDYHLNALERDGWLALPNKKSISIKQLNNLVKRNVNNLKEKMISVTIESYFRVKFRSINSDNNFGTTIVPSVIGNSAAREFKKTKNGLNSYFGNLYLKSSFDFLSDNYDDKNSFKRPINFYLSTHGSKKGGVYIKVMSMKQNCQVNYWDNYFPYSTILAEQGCSLKEVDDERKEWEQSKIDDYNAQENQRNEENYDVYGDTDLGDPRGRW